MIAEKLLIINLYTQSINQFINLLNSKTEAIKITKINVVIEISSQKITTN